MDNNNPISAILKTMFEKTGELAAAIKSGDGLNLSEDQKKEYMEQLEKQGVNKTLEDLEKQKREFFKNKI